MWRVSALPASVAIILIANTTQDQHLKGAEERQNDHIYIMGKHYQVPGLTIMQA
jgi:hypothetical protein